MSALDYIVFAVLLSFIPPIFWLWFWLKEDAHPEPKKEIIIVFFAGMGAVLLAIVLEKSASEANSFFKNILGYGADYFGLFNILAFALAEELSKTGAAFFTALRSKYFDEPVDAMIYLVTAALGFAALENVLFIGDSLKSGITESVAVSATRFINAVLLHVASSSIIGAGFAFSFFHKERRAKELIFAFFLATLLHSVYNFFIIKSIKLASADYQIMATLLVVLGASAALLLFEKARKVYN
mgnify:FL=1